MNPLYLFTSILLLSVLPFSSGCGDNLTDLLTQVEALNITRNGYTLGKTLTERKKETARLNPVKDSAEGTYKFRDRDLFVVADKNTDRVLILYEQYESTNRKKIRELVGSLFLDFGDPTVMAHERLLYWTYDQKGKLSEKDYQKIKKKKEQVKILATVKLSSSVKILGTGQKEGNISIYYIISSEPVLKRIQSREK